MATKSVLGRVLDQLGEDIVLGRYPSGSSLPPEHTLCTQLGVSRTVVREAVKSLVAKGLLVTGPKLGTRVLDDEQWNWFDPAVVAWHNRGGMTGEFLREVHELRRIIEPVAVAMAAERATAQDIHRLEQAYAGMRLALEGEGDYVLHDLAFHQGMLQACHNRMVGQMGKALAALLRTTFEVSTSRPHGLAGALPLHRAMLDAVVARQPAAAQQATLALIDIVGSEIDLVLATWQEQAQASSETAQPRKHQRAAPKAAAVAPATKRRTTQELEP